jgi:hypothetical protein
MKRPIVVAVGLLAILTAAGALTQPWGLTTRAQEERSIYVSISELRFGWTPDLPDGGTCSFVGQQFGLLSTVPMQIVVEDEGHEIIAVREVGGTIRHFEGDDWYRCDATFDLPLPEAAFYTFLVNDVTYSTVEVDALPFSSVIIVLESGESWRPTG